METGLDAPSALNEPAADVDAHYAVAFVDVDSRVPVVVVVIAA